MAVSTKYGKICIPTIRSDEPVFILRAQDMIAEVSIEMYHILAVSHGSKLAEYTGIPLEKIFTILGCLPDSEVGNDGLKEGPSFASMRT